LGGTHTNDDDESSSNDYDDDDDDANTSNKQFVFLSFQQFDTTTATIAATTKILLSRPCDSATATATAIHVDTAA
jgi:hypothetical protein